MPSVTAIDLPRPVGFQTSLVSRGQSTRAHEQSGNPHGRESDNRAQEPHLHRNCAAAPDQKGLQRAVHKPDDFGIHERSVKLHRTVITITPGMQSVAELTTLTKEAGVFPAPARTFPKGQ